MAARVKSANSGRRSSGGSSSGVSNGSRPSSTSGGGDRKVVGQYMLGKTIGEGTFGKVKLAVHLPTGEKLAVKILEKSRIRDQADVRRVNREIKILKKTRHANIIQLYEVLDTESTIYLIMENAEGGEMFDYIVSLHRVPEREACIFFHQIIDGVEALHNNFVTHRDLKPENLLLKPAVQGGFIVKIVDFGLSNTHEGGRLLQTACGSPCYAAPEMIAGKEYIGPVADMWSIGVILFALVCGYLPFEDQNTSVLYRKILSGSYAAPQWISADVKDLIRRILETDPRKRYTVRDVRTHPWYNQISTSDIPVDIVSVHDNGIHEEALAALKASGIDMQLLLDGLSSQSCNSTTAMYHMVCKKLLRKRSGMGGGNNNIPNGKEGADINVISPRNHPQAVLPALETKNNDLEQRVRESEDLSSKPANRYDQNAAAAVPLKYNQNINNNHINALAPIPMPGSLNGNTATPFNAQFANQHQQPSLPPNTTRQQVVSGGGNLGVKSGAGGGNLNPIINPYQQPPQLVVHPHAVIGDGQQHPGVQFHDQHRAHSAGANGTRSGGFRNNIKPKQPNTQQLPKQGSNGSTATASSAQQQSPYVPKLNIPPSANSASGNRAAYIHDLSDRVSAQQQHQQQNIIVSQTARDRPAEPLVPGVDGKQLQQAPLTARAPAAPAPSSASAGANPRRPVPGVSVTVAEAKNIGINGTISADSNATATNALPFIKKSNNQEESATTRATGQGGEPSSGPTAPVATAPVSSSVAAASVAAGGAPTADFGPVVVSPALAEILGINPEDIERPSTRRSHMRSRGGESRENNDTQRPQSAMGDDGMGSLGASSNIGVVQPMGRTSAATVVAAGVAALAAANVPSSSSTPAAAPVQTTAIPANTATVAQWPNRQPEKPPIVRPISSNAGVAAPVVVTRPAESVSAAVAPPSQRPSNSAQGGRRGRNIGGIPV